MTPEEQLIQRYFDAFNRHDIEGVMACFHEQPVIVDGEGRRFEGREAVRRSYETSFALFPDGRCDLRSCTGNDGRGMAESLFHGTRPREGRVVEAIGAEVMEIVDGKIKEIRDYHRPVPAKAA
jgi:taurine dehydrogenase small subunit